MYLTLLKILFQTFLHTVCTV